MYVKGNFDILRN